ncbi:MAG: membrane protein insertase YidC [candidate division Zixibacteria bacterium]|nr:membrane protein insertase YidC [candidate division Zixibacteria bacterium]
MSDESKPFDARALLGFALLIGLVLLLPVYWEWIGFKKPEPTVPVVTDSTFAVTPADTVHRPAPGPQKLAATPAPVPGDTAGGPFVFDSKWVEKYIHVETDVYDAIFSTRGARIVRLVLKNFRYNDEPRHNQPIIITDTTSDAGLRFHSVRDLFDWSTAPFTTDQADMKLAGGDSTVLRFTARSSKGNDVVIAYTIHGKRYDFDVNVSVPEPWTDGLENEYYFGWDGGLWPTEPDPSEDNSYFSADALMGKDFEKVSSHDPEAPRKNLSGVTHWAAVRTKYFVCATVPRSRDAQGFLAVTAERPLTFKGKRIEVKNFSSAVRMDLPAGTPLNDRFTVYIGPVEYGLLKSYGIGLEEMVDLGWRWLIRPIALVILWLFTAMHAVIPNYGVSLIIFALIIKVLFHPLTKKSTMSMRQMQALQPRMEKLRERHKGDPQKLNVEMMKLYKEAKINPLSGCLTLLPQMPIFFSLYPVFRSTIELRGAHFVGWISDLSQKDPYYVLPIIMVVSFFLQQKLSTKDPKQKMLTYILPLVFGFFFKDMPAGLTLYWTVFNLFSVIEMTWLIGHPPAAGADGEVGSGAILKTTPAKSKG